MDSSDILGSQMLHIQQALLYSRYREGLASISARTRKYCRPKHKVHSSSTCVMRLVYNLVCVFLTEYDDK